MLPFIDYLFMAGNQAFWSNTDKTAHWTISANGLTATGSGGPGSVRGNFPQGGAKLYFEITCTSTSGGNTRFVGIADASYVLAAGALGVSDAHSAGINSTDGAAQLRANTGAVSRDYPSFGGDPDIVGVAIDGAARRLYMHINGTYGPGGMNPSTSTGGIDYIFTGPAYPIVGQSTNSTTLVANFGGPFTYPVPTGYAPWGG